MKSSLIQVVLSVLVCVATMVGYGVWYAHIGKMSARAADLENQILAKTETQKHISEAQASLAEIAGDEASIQNYFVPETDIVTFIDNLQSLGHSQGATVGVLSVAKAGSASRPTFTLSISVNGTFDSVVRTIGAIEYSPYALTISTLTLSSGDKNVWNATFTVLVGSVSVKSATSTPKL